jgi:asparagine synthase (glutamine-hydrolysing)
VVALACHFRDKPIPAFTIRIKDPKLDETTEAAVVARHLKCEPVIVDCGSEEVLSTYPELIVAAESPVVDTSCAALLLLAREVHRQGYKAALTGEGADEWLAGYPWYKISKLLGFLDLIPRLRLSLAARRLFLKLSGQPTFPWTTTQRVLASVAGHNPWLDLYGMMSLSKLRFFSPELWKELGDHSPYEDLGANVERMRRWHPFNRGIYMAGRVHLCGHLLNGKGDRIAMHSSVETRYPFLDEDVFDFLAKVPPRLKMKGFKDKYLLRRLAERWLPKEVAWRRKAMFRAPFDTFHLDQVPPYVHQLLSDEALRKTGYFDPAAVRHWGQAFKTMRANSKTRLFVEMGLVGVFATQLWHQTYIDPNLADVPRRASGPAVAFPQRSEVRGQRSEVRGLTSLTSDL